MPAKESSPSGEQLPYVPAWARRKIFYVGCEALEIIGSGSFNIVLKLCNHNGKPFVLRVPIPSNEYNCLDYKSNHPLRTQDLVREIAGSTDPILEYLQSLIHVIFRYSITTKKKETYAGSKFDAAENDELAGAPLTFATIREGEQQGTIGPLLDVHNDMLPTADKFKALLSYYEASNRIITDIIISGNVVKDGAPSPKLVDINSSVKAPPMRALCQESSDLGAPSRSLSPISEHFADLAQGPGYSKLYACDSFKNNGEGFLQKAFNDIGCIISGRLEEISLSTFSELQPPDAVCIKELEEHVEDKPKAKNLLDNLKKLLKKFNDMSSFDCSESQGGNDDDLSPYVFSANDDIICFTDSLPSPGSVPQLSIFTVAPAGAGSGSGSGSVSILQPQAKRPRLGPPPNSL